jgi:hypothetical protein
LRLTLRPLSWPGVAAFSSILYVAVLFAAFVDRYIATRADGLAEATDESSLFISVGLLGVPYGFVAGRIWSALVPLLSFPVALIMITTAAVDPGIPVEAIWFALAGLVSIIACPSALIGYGARKILSSARSALRPGR